MTEEKPKNKGGRPKKKHPGGRPTVMTAETIARLEQAWALGCGDIDACKYAGIGERTLYDHCEKNPLFSQRKERLKQEHVLQALDTRQKLVAQGDWNATKDVLDRHLGKAKDKVELSGEVNFVRMPSVKLVENGAEIDFLPNIGDAPAK